MRKLLLASVFTIGAVGSAFAQGGAAGPNPMTGSMIAAPGPTPGANNNNNSLGTAAPGPSAVPTPGTMVIHMNARVVVQWAQGWNSGMGQTAGTSITSNQMGTWMRLYGGADGMAANGLRYGGAFEIRQNFVNGATNNVSTPSATGAASNASASTSQQTLFVRRAFAYVGTNQVGVLRVGMGDGLITLFDGGRTTVQTYSPTSHFNGSDLQTAAGGPSSPPFAFISGSGDEYDTQKIVYLSPNFSGFDFGLQYSPSAFPFIGGCSTVSSTCANLTSSGTAMDGARFKDMIAVGARYSGNVGPVNVLAYGVWSYAGHVNYTGTASAARTAISAPAASTWSGTFDNLNFASTGVALTWEGVTLGFNYIGGAVNGRMAARPTGGSTMNAFLVGAQYAVPGIPLTVGAAYESIDSQGAVAMTGISQRREYAIDVGGSYTLAPGMILFADYLYQNRKQSGWNFISSAAGTGSNQVQGQGFIVGTQMTW